nr:transposase [Nocardiopsis sp. CNT312]
MAMKHYPPEFKADAIALYRSRPGVTIAHIADELGINRETLRNWIRKDDDQRSTGTTPTRSRPGTRAVAAQSLEAVGERPARPSGGVLLDQPVQHPQASLSERPAQPARLRAEDD